ncbi:MAG: universal stress protein [Fibrella sp.]|nr:universal stress protein [Armatimonadota bacterium]
MNILLGIDRGANTDALTLVRRLRFSDATFDLNRVIPLSQWEAYGRLSEEEATLNYSGMQEIDRQEEADARATLTAASAYFTPEDGKCAIHIHHGSPVGVLMEHADASHTDLIAVNAAHQGAVLAFLTGSVARGLVTGAEQSVLLARGNLGVEGDTSHRVRAVLATDHSPYMNRCIDLLLRFRPQGLEHITVLTAYPEDSLDSIQSYLPNLAVSPAASLRRDLEERNHSLVRRLTDAFRPLSTTVSSQVSGEPVECAITRTMEGTGADLLIVGAQGHTLMERLTLGSVSFRQAMTAPYSVMVLRVGRAEIEEIRPDTKKADEKVANSGVSGTMVQW